jgi:hypothetical protein
MVVDPGAPAKQGRLNIVMHADHGKTVACRQVAREVDAVDVNEIKGLGS